LSFCCKAAITSVRFVWFSEESVEVLFGLGLFAPFVAMTKGDKNKYCNNLKKLTILTNFEKAIFKLL